MFSFEEVIQAYFDCREHKRYTRYALEFESDLERNLFQLHEDLINNVYKIGRSICFVVTEPKPREVWAAAFRDRVVHHIIYNRYSGIFFKQFIFDSYASIPNKGTLAAAERAHYFMRSCSNNYQKPTFYLKADIKNFFTSIDRDILDEIISRKIQNDDIHLIRQIIHHDPKSNCWIKNPNWKLDLVPNHKSLLKNGETGLPIGNLSSQLFANIYMNELDQYCKHVLKIKYYIRYVDDILLIGNDCSELYTNYLKMKEFVETTLKLEFHPDKLLTNKIENGINFVGYILKPYRKYLRRSTIQNMYKKEKTTDNVQATLNSYLGMMRHANCYNERVKLKENTKWMYDADITKIMTTTDFPDSF